MDVAELVREARRLALLRFLLESPAYRMPLAVLGEALETVGHGVASNTVLEDAIWLKKQGLVSMWRAKGSDALELSPQGYEVARGFVLCPESDVPPRTRPVEKRRSIRQKNILATGRMRSYPISFPNFVPCGPYWNESRHGWMHGKL